MAAMFLSSTKAQKMATQNLIPANVFALDFRGGTKRRLESISRFQEGGDFFHDGEKSGIDEWV